MTLDIFKNISRYLLVFISSLTATSVTLANPSLSGVTSGSATVTQAPNTTTINQTSQKAILQWNSFNIRSNEQTHFIQPAGGVALNRINPNQGPSQIFGVLTATGKVILVNGSGVFFGPGSQVNVGGLIASTADITNANFLNNKYIFDQASNRDGGIINSGTIKTADYGLVAFLGDGVRNDGKIVANFGTVLLASGGKFTLDFNGDQLINFTIDQEGKHANITNNGSIIARAGSVLVSVNAAKCVLDNAINMNGVVVANSVSQQNGEIILSANNGAINVKGKLIAEGNTPGSTGGTIKILAQSVDIESRALLNVRGDSTGGNIIIAGAQNGSVLTNAKFIDIDRGSLLDTSATSLTGASGGNIFIQGNDTTISGKLRTVVNSSGGTGGTINIAGANIDIEKHAILNASANGLGATGGLIVLGSNSNGPVTNHIDIDKRSVLKAVAIGDGGTGGQITLYAKNINVDGKLNASAKGMGVTGGTILLGSNPNVSGAQMTNNIDVDRNGILKAAAIGDGNTGGNITLYAVNTELDGKVNVSANGSGTTGGQAEVLGNHITLESHSLINATADSQGGNVFIGGGLHGAGPQPNAITLTMMRGSSINASATNSGMGGEVVLWSNTKTNFKGSIYAKGGPISGDGGLVEIASPVSLKFKGNVDVSAPNGNAGVVLNQ